MRPHFPSAEPQTASEALKQEDGFSAVLCDDMVRLLIFAPVQWLAGSMNPLSLGKRRVPFQVPDTLQSCCLLLSIIVVILQYRSRGLVTRIQNKIRFGIGLAGAKAIW